MLCLPLTDDFDPPPGQQGHGKLQVSDRVSVPKEIAFLVLERKPEPPWQFVLASVPAEVEDKPNHPDNICGGEPESFNPEPAQFPGSLPVKKLYCHILDWQAPRNHIFVPKWMMQTLCIKPRDVVELTWVRLREGAQVTLKPRTKQFSSWANPQAVMESELKYYSSLTVGSTIAIEYKGDRHALEVVKLMNGEEQMDGANIYDVNVAVDFTGVKSGKKTFT